MPWARTEPQPLLTQWAEERQVTGSGRRAVVAGCGLGADAEYVARLGFDTVAFDVAATAIRVARQRFPGTRVRYVTADLLKPPGEWLRAFDLVVEIITVQALPEPPRHEAIVNVGRLVGADGTLIAIAAARDESETPVNPPPWPLTRGEVDAFGTDGLVLVRLDDVADPVQPTVRRWRAEFTRPRLSPPRLSSPHGR